MMGIGTPSSQSSIGISSSLPGSRYKPAFIPCAVAMLPAFDRSQACGKRSKQQGGSHPERKFHGASPRPIKSILRLSDHVIDPLLRISFAHTGLLGDQMGDIGAIGGLQGSPGCEA